MNGTPCLHCGAAGCDERFQRCLAADFSDPEYGAVHHLVVPTYGLQHGWYVDGASRGVVRFVVDHLDHAPRDHDRARIREAVDGPQRVRTRRPEMADVPWERTVADVDLTSAQTYTVTVRDWAASVTSQLTGRPGR